MPLGISSRQILQDHKGDLDEDDRRLVARFRSYALRLIDAQEELPSVMRHMRENNNIMRCIDDDEEEMLTAVEELCDHIYGVFYGFDAGGDSVQS